MKKYILLGLMCLCYAYSFAQKPNADYLAYQLQRKKINTMLDERRQKFGQYSESLTKHTGIFGLQTKKDIRRSNDILMDIAKTDEGIFEQIKILLNYRTYQQEQVQTHSQETENSNLSFMNTINRLRQQVDLLNQEALKEKQHQEKMLRNYIIIFALMLGSILYLTLKKSAVKV
jgi:hypothetical protein